jgi:hypothetical protein
MAYSTENQKTEELEYDEEELQELVDDLSFYRTIAIDYKDGRFSSEWLENTQFYIGNQYTKEYTDNLASWRSLSVNNIIFQTIEQVHALLTDDQTIAFVRRVAGGSYQVERILDNLIKQTWDKQRVPEIMSAIEKDRLFFGFGIIKVWYNKYCKELLKVQVERISPFDFYIDPLANCVDEAEYIYERKRVSKSWLLEHYPDFADKIVVSDGLPTDAIGEEGAKTRTSNEVMSSAVYIWYCYFKDLTLLEYDNEEAEDTSVKAIKKRIKKYPHGRCVVLYGDVVLEDYALKTGFPYINVPLIKMPDEFFGQSLITPMKFAQEELNALESMIVDNTKSNTNPIWVATEGVIDVDQFVPIPNSVITMRNKNEDMFDKVGGVQLPSEVFQMLAQKRQEIMASAGVSDVTFGSGAQSSRPGTVRANFNASITRIREFLRGSHRAIEEIGKKIIKEIQINTPVNTTVSLANRDDAPIDFLDDTIIEQIAESLNNPAITKNLKVVNVIVNEKNPEFKAQLDQLVRSGQAGLVIPEKELREMVLSAGVMEWKNDLTEGEYDYVVSSHPLTVNDPDQMMELLTMLLQYGNADPSTGSPGIIDYQFVLDNINLPNKADLIKRLKKKEEFLKQQMQAQTQAQTQQSAPQQAQQQGV